tara:strand:- start:2411 stop:3628 length:1218 start_codon:yes stop_codon:yes gene_type:complete
MGKISPVVAKYIIHSDIDIGGIVDKPDVIGAIFGQTEGLLGADLELRELQRSGRIGRIEVNTSTRAGKTTGNITIPSSLDKAETSIIGAALEIIQRIGPCNAKIQVKNIEDVRVSKRNMVIQRAKALLKMMMDNVIPDSQELSDEVASAVRVMEIEEFGRDRLPAGPNVDESEDVIVVEGRADVLNLLKHGFKNVIAINGSSVPQTIVELSKRKEITVFADGDRGGDLIIRELTNVADIDFVVKAPDGKEVEEITKKEIHKALRGKVSVEQVKLDSNRNGSKEITASRPAPVRKVQRPFTPPVPRGVVLTVEEKQKFKKMLEELIGTRGAEIVDEKLNILGKVPISELQTALRNTNNIHAIIFDGVINRGLIKSLETSNVKHLVAMDSNVGKNEAKINIITSNDL